MWVKRLSLCNFRNIAQLQTELFSGVNIVYGDNAQGKTNFLEAINFCAMGRSQRAAQEGELVSFGQREAYLRAEVIDAAALSRTIDAYLRKAEHPGKKIIKGVAVDHVPVKQLNELFGLLVTVSFSPEDLQLVKAGPAERRAFMDRELCQMSPVYYHALKQYYHALKQRNNLLRSIQKDKSLQETLFIWDEPLVRFGRKIMEQRDAFISKAGERAGENHRDLTGGKETLSLQYRPNIINPDDYEDKLCSCAARDITLGSTSFGVHKDDILFTVNGSDARSYGSQGQKRTAALSAKLAEIDVIKESMNRQPVLLLDDVLSELDAHRQSFLLKKIGAMQVILACTGVEDILKKSDVRGSARIMRMVNGTLEEKM